MLWDTFTILSKVKIRRKKLYEADIQNGIHSELGQRLHISFTYKMICFRNLHHFPEKMIGFLCKSILRKRSEHVLANPAISVFQDTPFLERRRRNTTTASSIRPRRAYMSSSALPTYTSSCQPRLTASEWTCSPALPGQSRGAARAEHGRCRGRAGAGAPPGPSGGAARAERGRRRGPSRGAADRGSPPTTAVRENYSCEAAAGARVPAWYLC
jgi:hypothetical protein